MDVAKEMHQFACHVLVAKVTQSSSCYWSRCIISNLDNILVQFRMTYILTCHLYFGWPKWLAKILCNLWKSLALLHTNIVDEIFVLGLCECGQVWALTWDIMISTFQGKEIVQEILFWNFEFLKETHIFKYSVRHLWKGTRIWASWLPFMTHQIFPLTCVIGGVVTCDDDDEDGDDDGEDGDEDDANHYDNDDDENDDEDGDDETPWKDVFDVTSVGQCSLPWTCNLVKVKIKFHLECKLRFPGAQLMLWQIHLTKVFESIKANYWVSWLSFDI